ncbi:MAG: tetratricopeptide repeat protein [Proteobacteria bacterium]|nr:tetratricopeptide repeat protein [Pseudomonadota bacterium]
MDDYISEEQSVEALKKWWQENYTSILWGLVLGFAVLTSWNIWQSTKQRKADEASGLYQQLLKAVDAKQAEPAIKLSERIIEQFQGSTYATYATLFAAKLKAEAGDLTGAKKALSDLLAASKDGDIKHLARLRLGEVLLALGENEAALKLFEPLKPRDMGKYESLYEELKGDVYATLDRTSEALAAYELAKEKGDTTPLLELKINNLAVDSASTPAPAQ